MAPSVPRTRAAAALRMKQITLDNQDCTIRRLRAQLATERRELATTKKELGDTQVALEASHKVIAGLTEIGLSISKKIERMKVNKQKVRANHVECHQKFQARIHEAEDSMQAQHLLIEALVDEKDILLQTIHGTKKNISRKKLIAQRREAAISVQQLVQYKDSAVGLVFIESAVELAMETSRVESVVRNQARAKLNQLEHGEPAGTMTTNCKR
ncbi:nuclear matrix constituent protein 1-like protein [Dorcoceras hygrometricum]|uniref:Nuclear matrix constituent protein 1-like protein n=1 Tax=Dorcoceras hygrometricum TaxID=472368 RepID=A0A2Z7AQD8_9LAMI|nr:nuclear matrix constituent protein 1-like protein [Dorcoceras hygrometricum]